MEGYIMPSILLNLYSSRPFPMANTKDEYDKPEVEELTPSVTFTKETETPALSEAKAIPSVLAEEMVIGINSIVNAKGTDVTEIMVARIDRHLAFLRGDVGFSTDKEADDEQISFIETIGNTLKLPYEQYVLVTDHFLQLIREDKDIFLEGKAYRFMGRLERKYSGDVLVMYRNYIQLLTQISLYWGRRYALNRLMDIATPIKAFDTTSKENFTRYFRELQNV